MPILHKDKAGNEFHADSTRLSENQLYQVNSQAELNARHRAMVQQKKAMAKMSKKAAQVQAAQRRKEQTEILLAQNKQIAEALQRKRAERGTDISDYGVPTTGPQAEITDKEWW